MVFIDPGDGRDKTVDAMYIDSFVNRPLSLPPLHPPPPLPLPSFNKKVLFFKKICCDSLLSSPGCGLQLEKRRRERGRERECVYDISILRMALHSGLKKISGRNYQHAQFSLQRVSSLILYG